MNLFEVYLMAAYSQRKVSSAVEANSQLINHVLWREWLLQAQAYHFP